MVLFNFFKKNTNNDKQIKEMTKPQESYSNINEQIKILVESISNLSKDINEIKTRVSEISQSVDDLNSKVQNHQEEITNMKNSIEKMFSIYEVLIKNYNPFIEEEQIKNIKIQEEKQVNETNHEKNNKILPLQELKNEPRVASIIIGWLAYLVSKSNISETEKALDYYTDIEWISEKVNIKLKEYLKLIDGYGSENKKLTPQDHLVSLYIITKLATIDEKTPIEKIKDIYKELIERGYINPIKVKNE